jgi:4'-phosphopantetheinyl transferase
MNRLTRAFSELNNSDRWLAAPAHPILGVGDIHLWRGWLDLSPAVYSSAISVLTSEDLARAAAYHFKQDRSRFIAARATLRGILSRYVTRAHHLRFRHAEMGKPTLAESIEQIHFNVSHADGLMVCAVARAEVGVDVERHHSAVDPEEILRLMFPSAEVKEQGEGKKRDPEFLRWWTRTEAIAKLDGSGLCGAHSFDPTICVEYFESADGYLGAVTLRNQPIRLHRFQWSFE